MLTVNGEWYRSASAIK